MEYENGGLYVTEGSIPTIGQKRKIFNDYEGQRMGGS